MPPVERIFPVIESIKSFAEPYEDVRFDIGNTSNPGNGEVYVVINMVSSLDGRVQVDGKSGAIGSDVDRSAMRTLRSKVDAVMVGSGTVRAEVVSLTSEGKASPEPYAVIPTGNLDIPLHDNLKDNDPERTIILTTTEAVRKTTRGNLEDLKLLAHIVECQPVDPGSLGSSSSRPNLKQATELLAKNYDIKTLLLEGGPSLNTEMISHGLVREIFLTISPKLLGGRQQNSSNILSGKRLDNMKALPMEIYTSRKTSELFLRYKLQYPFSFR